MFEDIHHHLFHYLALFIILLGGLLVFFSFSYRTDAQWLVAISMAILYVIWAIGHHLIIDKHLHFRIVIEYILISLIGLLLVRAILFL